MVRLGDYIFVWSQNGVGFILVNIDSSKNHDKPNETGIIRTIIKPIIVKVEHKQLWLLGLQN